MCEANLVRGLRAGFDETGWHVGGRNAWLHGLVGPDATAYVCGSAGFANLLARVLIDPMTDASAKFALKRYRQFRGGRDDGITRDG